MKACRKCGLLPKDCKCHNKSAPETINCKTCNVIHKTAYIIQGQCHDCWEISALDPVDREYYRTLSDKYSLKPFDIPLHIRAANAKNQQIETYLASLPRNHEQHRAYWKGKNPSLGGVPLL